MPEHRLHDVITVLATTADDESTRLREWSEAVIANAGKPDPDGRRLAMYSRMRQAPDRLRSGWRPITPADAVDVLGARLWIPERQLRAALHVLATDERCLIASTSTEGVDQ
jgi:hypothetical protein